MLKKRTKIIIAIVIVGFVINASFWGTCFEHMGGFQSALARPFKDFVEDHQLAPVRIGEGQGPWFGIPFVFWVFCLEKPPFYLDIRIDDETSTLARLVLETVHVDYGNGDTKKFELNLDKKFVPSKIHRAIGDGTNTIIIPTMLLEEKLPAIVEKNKSCTVRLIGFFVDSSGNKLPFETEDYFEYEPTYWRMYPLASSSF